jgi:hypothetical protein
MEKCSTKETIRKIVMFLYIFVFVFIPFLIKIGEKTTKKFRIEKGKEEVQREEMEKKYRKGKNRKNRSPANGIFI